MKQSLPLLWIMLFTSAVSLSCKETHNTPDKTTDNTSGTTTALVSHAPPVQILKNLNEKTYPGTLTIIETPQWSYKKISRVGYFYQNEALCNSYSHEVEVTLKEIAHTLSITPAQIKQLKINLLLFNSQEWEELLYPGNSFFIKNTSLIYLDAANTPCAYSRLRHELMHLTLSQLYDIEILPLWIQEGLALLMERPECLNLLYDAHRQFSELLHEKKTIPLRELITLKEYPADDIVFYLQSLMLLYYIQENFRSHTLKDFLTVYISTHSYPGLKDFERALTNTTRLTIDIDTLEKKIQEYILTTVK